MKRIAIVGMTSNPGGVERYLLNFTKAMSREFKLMFVNVNPTQKLAYENELLNSGCEIFLAQGKFSLQSYFGRMHIAKRILQETQADIVYVNALTTNNAYWVKAANKLKLKSVYHSHNTSAFFDNRLKKIIANIIKPYNQHILKFSTQLAVSDQAGKFMFGSLKKVQIIYNSIDVDQWKFNYEVRKKYRESLKVSQDDKLIAVIGRLEYQKNPLKALNICKQLHTSDKSYKFIFVGDGNLKNELSKQIEKFSLQLYVKILGVRNDIPQLMWSSDYLLLPSRFEGLPFVVIEAQGAGLPIIASKGVIPSLANITNQLSQISLTDSDTMWSEKIRSIPINDYNTRKKLNKKMENSKFSKGYFNRQINDLFATLK